MALLAFSGGLTAVLLMLPKLRRYIFPVVLMAAGIFLAIDRMRTYDRLQNDFSRWRNGETVQQPYSPLMRLVYWDVAWRMGRDHPWTGVGLNNYRKEFKNYYSGPLQGGAIDWGSAHNLYLQQVAERGLLGVAALLLLFTALWNGSFRRVRQDPNAWNLWAWGGITAFLIMNLTEVAFQTEILWMLVLFIWIHAEKNKQ
jgi:O-antigen ligase